MIYNSCKNNYSNFHKRIYALPNKKKTTKQLIAEIISTWFYVGKIPFAPGTMGSLVAAIMILPIIIFMGLNSLIILTIACFFIGKWSSDVMIDFWDEKDPSQIVIDEVVGMWLTFSLFLLSLFALIKLEIYSYKENSYTLASAFFIISFLMFRLFDIWKPFPVSWADTKIKGGLGVMLDDVIAAIYAGLASTIIWLGWSLLTFS